MSTQIFTVCDCGKNFYRSAEETIPGFNTDLVPLGTQVLDFVSCS